MVICLLRTTFIPPYRLKFFLVKLHSMKYLHIYSQSFIILFSTQVPGCCHNSTFKLYEMGLGDIKTKWFRLSKMATLITLNFSATQYSFVHVYRRRVVPLCTKPHISTSLTSSCYLINDIFFCFVGWSRTSWTTWTSCKWTLKQYNHDEYSLVHVCLGSFICCNLYRAIYVLVWAVTLVC